MSATRTRRQAVTVEDIASVQERFGGSVVLPVRARVQVEKFWVPEARELDALGLQALADAEQLEALRRLGLDPYEVIDRDHNLLLFGGASAFFHRLTGGTTVTAYDNTNSFIGVGDSTTAAAATQTDLQAVTNKLRKAMDATYPQHTDATTSGGASAIWRSTFATGDANYAWQEWILANHATAGRALNRKVESLGTKTSAAAWVFTLTLSLA